MPIARLHTSRLRLPGILLGAFLAIGASGTAHAENDPTMLYIYSVTAPALKAGCEEVIPGYAESFDHFFEQWLVGNKDELDASRHALLDAHPNQSLADLDEAIETSAKEDFEGADGVRRQAVCKGLMDFMAASFGPEE